MGDRREGEGYHAPITPAATTFAARNKTSRFSKVVDSRSMQQTWQVLYIERYSRMLYRQRIVADSFDALGRALAAQLINYDDVLVIERIPDERSANL